MKVMKKTLNKLKNRVSFALNLELLSQTFLNFAKVHFGYLVGTTLIGTFVNTLFYGLSGGVDQVLFFNLIVFALTPLAKIASIFILKKNSFVSNFKFSFFAYIFAYIMFFALMVFKVPALTLVAAAAVATGHGFYRVAYSLSVIQYIGEEKRAQAMSLIGMMPGFVIIVVPVILGQVISFCPGLWGYGILNGLCIAILFCTIRQTRKLKRIFEQGNKPEFGAAVKLIFGNKMWFFNAASELFRGVRDGLIGFLPTILMFETVKKESIVSVSIFLTGVLTILANSLCSRILQRFNIKSERLAFACICILEAATLPLLFGVSVATVVVWVLVNAFVQGYITGPTFSSLCFLMNKDPNGRVLKAEIFMVKACFAACGRVLGVLLFWSLRGLKLQVFATLFVITAVQNLTLYLCQKIQKH